MHKVQLRRNEELHEQRVCRAKKPRTVGETLLIPVTNSIGQEPFPPHLLLSFLYTKAVLAEGSYWFWKASFDKWRNEIQGSQFIRSIHYLWRFLTETTLNDYSRTPPSYCSRLQRGVTLIVLIVAMVRITRSRHCALFILIGICNGKQHGHY